MVDLYDFYNLMDRHNIMLSFKGEVSADLVTSILQITESKLERMNEERERQGLSKFANPRNAGAMEDADAQAYVTNPVCGDSLRLFLRIEDGHIARASFLSSGCPARSCVPVSTPGASSNPGGANTMMVEPCSNQPISSPRVTRAVQRVTFGPRKRRWRCIGWRIRAPRCR